MWQGRLAQLVERLPYKERVRSSSLLTPTIKYQMTFVIWYFIMRLDDEKLQTEVRADFRTDDANKCELVRVARILSKFEPKVLLRNYSSVKKIQEKSSNAHHKKRLGYFQASFFIAELDFRKISILKFEYSLAVLT